MTRFNSEEEARAAGVYISKVKSFVKREGRLTNAQAKALTDNWPTMGLSTDMGKLDLNDVFGRNAPRVVEIGFGMGKSLVEMAKNAPEKDFIGIEVHKPGVGACLGEAAEQAIENLRVFEHDAVEVLDTCLDNESIERLQLFFPDPWHKTRHHKRRIVQPAFVQSIRAKLKIGGEFHMATDWEPYAEHMINVMEASDGFENTAENNHFVPRPDYRPLTKFEARGQRLGHGVWDIIYKRVS
ncbi:tRNA (guanosine(46)-N7)-methyltransferase TrmB [Agaribacter marinus]|uniref:tRNA (guanine-N(7)-)-methyltransferase n=1 Tax=Agaribacter marinus TaxID=1431249 RepID=A0AA37WI42_9ALTE|nr:tRNA (guanosine(46)-N7)-methyltransferase TrmB [Agaribacter marinus]GLR71731.1 tRNA (guanine-N(7)-)-methyltransferase [Agaribacter marinus]